MKCQQCQREAFVRGYWDTQALGRQNADLCKPCLDQLHAMVGPLLKSNMATMTLSPLPKPKRRGLLAIWRTSTVRRWLHTLLGRRPVRTLNTFEAVAEPRYETTYRGAW